MHIPPRLRTGVLLGLSLAAAVPVFGFSLRLTTILLEGTAPRSSPQLRASLAFEDQRRSWEERLLEENEARAQLTELAREKRAIRLQRQSVRDRLQETASRFGIGRDTVDFLADTVLERSEELRNLLWMVDSTRISGVAAIPILRPALLATFPEPEDRERIEHMFRKTREGAVALIQTLLTLPTTDELLASEHGNLIASHSEALTKHEELHDASQGPRPDFEENRRIVAEVQRQIARLERRRSSLERGIRRTSAQARRTAERRLIWDGKLPKKKGTYSREIIFEFPGSFGWPVLGRISAGFLSPSYEAHFGVPHYGLDIAAPQGTPVRSSAAGIVFHVRDGGPRGYSYVLIAHAGGKATLYGHLTEIFVEEGQEVSGGQIIGRSGGVPGTHGAGPMTTGAHVHLEVIVNGQHVDPLTVLPAEGTQN